MSKKSYCYYFLILTLWSINFFGFSSESVAGDEFSNIQPPALIATIQGRSHAPKKYIRVEIKGPEYKKMATNSKGIISTTLKPGDYIVHVRERGRQMEFELTVDENTVTRTTFVLAW